MEEILRVEDLHYTYADGTIALNGINLTIKKGEKVAIMGANGSGKSTFFLQLNGILKPTKGRILIEGEPINYSRKGLLSIRKKVGIVFQNPDSQLFSASVVQDISFGILNLGVGKVEALEKVNRVMEELDIQEFSEKPTHFLSGGQKKRVSIADILVMEPDIMIFDEPTSELDPKHARMIDEIIDLLTQRGISVILSTHNVGSALGWADRVVIFDEGKIVGDGTPEEIFTDEALLEKTNLEKPGVLRIFEAMCQAGLLDRERKLPRTMEDLEEYIKERAKG
ncbi:MAG: ATP-binding cassette domain-containing protein [Anaerovoracaceae bacterium]